MRPCGPWLALLGLSACAAPVDPADTVDTDPPAGVDTDPVHTDPPDTVAGPDDTDTDARVDADTDDTATPHTGRTGPLPAQPLLISEVGDLTADVKYVEICNPGPAPVPLDGWSLGRLGAGSYQPLFEVPLDPLGVLQPGEAFLVARDPATQRTFLDTFGADALPDQYAADVVLGDGDDPYLLRFGGVPIDVFGDPARLTPWYTDLAAVRDEAAVTPRLPWRPPEWTIGTFDRASPGLCLGAGPWLPTDEGGGPCDDGDTFECCGTGNDCAWPHTGPDTWPDPVDDPDVAALDDLAAGDLVLTELMPGTDVPGCELLAFVVAPYSLSPFPDYVDLHGLTLTDQAGHAWTYTGTMLVAPGTEVVAMPAAADDAACFGLGGAALRYTGFDLTDAGDLVRLRNRSELLDQVSYVGWPEPGGAVRSWELDDGVFDAGRNDDPGAWCRATSRIDGFAAFGTPGRRNDDCDVVPPDTSPPDTSDGDSDPDTQVPPPQSLADLGEGALVVTELLIAPDLAACGAAPGQYLELRNTTDAPVDLDGLEVRVPGGVATVTGPAIVGAAPAVLGGSIDDPSIVLLAPGPLASHCFAEGLTLAFAGRSFPWTGAVVLPDVCAMVELAYGDTVFDTVDVTAWDAPAYVGQAWSVTTAQATAAGNDDPAAWCHGGYHVGPGHVGTMGGVFACAP